MRGGRERVFARRIGKQSYYTGEEESKKKRSIGKVKDWNKVEQRERLKEGQV